MKVCSLEGGSVVTIWSPAVLGGIAKVIEKLPLLSAVAVVTSSSSYLTEILLPEAKPVALAFTSIPTGPLSGSISSLGVAVKLCSVDGGSVVTLCSPRALGGTLKTPWRLPLSSVVAIVTSLSSYLRETLLFAAKPVALALTPIPIGPLSGSISSLGVMVKVCSVDGGSVLTLCSPVVLGGTVKVI